MLDNGAVRNYQCPQSLLPQAQQPTKSNKDTPYSLCQSNSSQQNATFTRDVFQDQAKNTRSATCLDVADVPTMRKQVIQLQLRFLKNVIDASGFIKHLH